MVNENKIVTIRMNKRIYRSLIKTLTKTSFVFPHEIVKEEESTNPFIVKRIVCQVCGKVYKNVLTSDGKVFCGDCKKQSED